MLVISDTSPLRYLARLVDWNCLQRCLGEIWAPGAVIAELSASGAPDHIRALLENCPPWLHVQEPREDIVANVTTELDRGERALALAIDLNADLLLVDDAAGRREAVALGIRITGTVGVLLLAAERGLIDVPSAVAELRRSGFYISDSVIAAAFGQWL